MFNIKSKLAYFKNIFVLIVILLLSACAEVQEQNKWNNTVKAVSSGIVSIQMDIPVSFDGKWNNSSYATGFIVDHKRGIILTNRHVVTPGPITAKAILINNEEIDLTPLYIDPVHDFGFFKYDPQQIKYITPHEFVLSDKLPNVGEDIRIIGNDAGQKVSILAGTIARLDRDAPNYGRGTYNDFNIFYIQAATASTGGSSGSPVINIAGEAVALNAGSQSSSSNAFYLPLPLVKQALEKLQNDIKISRGTIQTTFNSTPYAELQRLGLTEALAAEYRQQFPELQGLLVARMIIPESSAAQVLAVGDILLSIDGQPVAEFLALENHLNSHVGKEIQLSILRRGEKNLVPVHVDDLNAISPNSFLKFDGSVFHNLSYQQARHFNKPVKGVFVANSSGEFNQAGVPNFAVITEFNGVAIDNINQLNEQLTVLPNNQKVHLRYFTLNNPNTSNYALVEINRNWFEHSFCVLDQRLGYWPCEEILTAITNNQTLNVSDVSAPIITNNIEDALVRVNFTSPYSIQGRSGNNSRYGTGLVVEPSQGWVVVPRSVVFSMLGDVKLTFGNRLEIPGKIEYIHPLHNLALISYSPSALGNIPVGKIKLSNEVLKSGQDILQLGLNYDGQVEYRQTQVDTTQELWLRQFNVPQFIEKNLEVVYLVNPNYAIDGVIINAANEVSALWANFEESDEQGKGIDVVAAGLGAEYIHEIISLASDHKPLYSLDLGLTQIPPVSALQMGMPDIWLTKFEQANQQKGLKNKNKFIAINNIAASSASAKVFKRGDILLAINNTPVTSFRQAELLSQSPNIEVTYLSQGQVLTTQLNTTPLNGNDIEQVFYWSGVYVHAPHRAAQLQGNIPADGVYVASYTYGSPATRYQLYAMQRIVEIDGNTINNTDDFVKAVQGKKHQEDVLIKTLDFNNNPIVTTLRVNNNYWPFYEMNYQNGSWQKINYRLTSVK